MITNKTIIILVCFFALYTSTCYAQEQEIAYPVKQEYIEKTSLLLAKLDNYKEDLGALFNNKDFMLYGATLEIAELKIYEELFSIYFALIIEKQHGMENQFNCRSMTTIKEYAKGAVPNCDLLTAQMNEWVESSPTSVYLKCEQLKRYISEFKGLLQNLVTELKDTMKVLGCQ